MTHMIWNGFALGAVLFAALTPAVAHGDLLIRITDTIDGYVAFTGPTSINTLPPGSGFSNDACWSGIEVSECGAAGFGAGLSFTALPATSYFEFMGTSGDTVEGTVDWTAVNGYPTAPELIGTFTVGGVATGLYSSQFAGDFPIGSIDTIDLHLYADPSYCSSVGAVPGTFTCLVAGPVSDINSVTVPEPATLSILGVALGICRWPAVQSDARQKRYRDNALEESAALRKRAGACRRQRRGDDLAWDHGRRDPTRQQDPAWPNPL